MFKHLKQMNSEAISRSKVRLAISELPQFALMTEYEILTTIHCDIRKQQNRPTPQHVEDEYRSRVDKSIRDVSILKNFIAKVKSFHRRVKDVLKKVKDALKKVKAAAMTPLQCLQQRLEDAEAARQREAQHQIEQAKRDEKWNVTGQELVHALGSTIFETNQHMSIAENGGQSILSEQQILEAARHIEAYVHADLTSKYQAVAIEFDLSLDEYITMGKEYLNKIRIRDSFVEIITLFHPMQP